MAKESSSWVEKHDLSKVIGSVGDTINDESLHWYNDHVGKKNVQLVDTGGKNRNRRNYDFSASFVTPTANLRYPSTSGNSTVLMDEKRNEITGNQVDGNLASVFLGRELPEQFGVTSTL